MRKTVWTVFIAVCIAVAPVAAFSDKEQGGYQRIVSLLPSITEILFTLGQGDKVVGVTRYCKHPPEAQQKTIVGGILDTGFETVYHLNPDLVLMEETAMDQKEKLDKMGFKTLTLDTRSVDGILGSIRVLGDVLQCQEKASTIIANIRGKIEYVQSKTKGLPKTRVLVTYLRPVGEGTIREVYIAGNRTYFNDLIEIAGGKNVYEGPDLITSPVVSAEGILRMDPDVIIEVINMLDDVNVTEQQVLDDWKMLPELKAYKNNRIHVFNQPYIGIPGPRIALAVEDFARVVHPEINWGKE
mgnify:CR=1 FL=1